MGRIIKHPVRFAWWAVIVLLMTACTSAKRVPVQPADTSAQTCETERQIGTPQLWDAVSERAQREGRPALGLLNHGDEALVARLNLIRSARTEILIQTFIWSNDECGRLFLWELMRAVRQRGVQVRIIVDPMFSAQDADVFAWLATFDPRLRVSVYNPSAERIEPGWLFTLGEAALDFARVNKRMHNKVMIVDRKVAITGGRNHANEYYDRTMGLNFKDRDVLVVGKTDVRPAVDAFEAYWRSPWTVPAERLRDVEASIARVDMSGPTTRADFAFYPLVSEAYALASDRGYVQRTFIDRLISVRRLRWVTDEPGKNDHVGLEGGGATAMELRRMVANAVESVVIQSPYLVLSDPAINLFTQLREERPDVRVRISTNSLAATDSWPTYAASYRQKRMCLEDLGMTIWEFKPLPGDMASMMNHRALVDRLPTVREARETQGPPFDVPAPDVPAGASSASADAAPVYANRYTGAVPYLCLHAKSVVVDRRLAFVGSYNFDPRSENLNTEAGLIVDDAEFAKFLERDIERDMDPANSYLIAIRRRPIGFAQLNHLVLRFSEKMPVDVWPLRYAASFELRSGGAAVPADHPTFYDNWWDVGSFPMLSPVSDKALAARLFKMVGLVFHPIL